MSIYNYLKNPQKERANTASFIDAISKFGPEQIFEKVIGKKDLGVSEFIAGKNNPYYTGGNLGAYEPVTAPVDNRNPFLEQGLLDPLNINTTSNNNSSGSTQQTKQPTTTNNFDPMNRNIDPGPGYFWDAADGWKLVGGGSSYDAERARREQEARDNINSGFGQHVNNLNNLIPHYRLARLTLSAVNPVIINARSFSECVRE